MNARRKKRGPEIARKDSRYVVNHVFSDRAPL